MGMTPTRQLRGYEKRDISVGAVLLFAAGLVLAMITVLYLATGAFRYFASRPTSYPPPSPLASTREPFTGPRLAVNQSHDMETLRASEETVLNNYDWVDRAQGVVRIPIDRAMELLAHRESRTNHTTSVVSP